MLVLSRKCDQKIVIGDDGGIKITIVDIGNGRVRIGIEAPRGLPVHREEVWEEIQRRAKFQKESAEPASGPVGETRLRVAG